MSNEIQPTDIEAIEGDVLGTVDLSTFAELSTDDKLIEIYRQIKRAEVLAGAVMAQAEDVIERLTKNPMLSAFLS